MKALSVSQININAPYKVWNEGKLYRFETDFGISYIVDFEKDDNPLFTSYWFNLTNPKHTKSPGDIKIALDFKTDKNLRHELTNITKNSTVLIVAQRINTVLNADQIIVLDEGKIVGIGNHEELMKNCEIYKEIALSQLTEEELNGK